jgi:hypothetical protein
MAGRLSGVVIAFCRLARPETASVGARATVQTTTNATTAVNKDREEGDAPTTGAYKLDPRSGSLVIVEPI